MFGLLDSFRLLSTMCSQLLNFKAGGMFSQVKDYLNFTNMTYVRFGIFSRILRVDNAFLKQLKKPELAKVPVYGRQVRREIILV